MDYKAFAERTKDKTFDEIIHDGKQKAQQLLEDQGITAIALYISEMIVKSIEHSRNPFIEKGVA